MEVNSLKINERIAALEDKGATILWTNPNPDQEFSSQIITLSSDDYDFLDIYALGIAGSVYIFHTRLLKGYSTVLWQPIGEGEGGQIGYRMRNFNWYDSHSTFSVGNGLTKLAGTSTAAVIRNDVMVPVRIYGIKLIK